MNKNIFLLWQGQLISQLGTQAFSIAMMFWLMENIGSSILMSIILTISILPSIVLGAISGVLADKVSRKKIIVFADIIRGIVVLSLALSLIYGVTDKTVVIILFAITALINGVCRALFQPAIDAWIPDIVSNQQLPKTIAFFSTSTQCATILGQALGGILYRILGAPVLLLLDALSYIFSAISECFIKVETKPKNDEHLSFKLTITSYKTDLLEGFYYVKNKKGMFQTMLFASSINFFIAPFMLLLPFYVAEQLSSPVQWYGFLLAGMGLGSLLGFWVSAMLKPSGNQRAIIMFSSILILSLFLLLLGQSFENISSLIYLSIVGFCLGMFNLQSMTLFQTSSPSEIRGRVMGLLMTASSALLPLGLIISGGLGALTNNDTQFIFSLSALLLALLTMCFILSTNSREFLFSNRKDS
jgi:MFS family permease